MDATIQGEKGQPSDADLRRIGRDVLAGKTWSDVFKGASAVEMTTDGVGPNLSLRLSKKEGIPIKLVVEGTPGASVVAVKRVDELGFYSLGAKQLAENLSLTVPKAIAVVDHLGLRDNPDCYKEFRIGKTVFKRYSQKAIEVIGVALQSESAESIWEQRRRERSA